MKSNIISRISRTTFASVTFVTLFVLATAALPAPASAAAVWHLTANQMSSPHGNNTNTGMATLSDGRVLIASGDAGNGSLTAATDIYDPSTNLWSPTGAVNQSRYAYAGAITLNTGKVLIAGGTDVSASTDYASAELYDPATGQWSYTSNLNTPRRYPVAVKLQDGRVMVASGAHGVPDGNRFLFTAEIYDPVTGQWSYTGNLNVAREGGDAATLLHDGRVMILGGEGPWFTESPEVELYDPSTGAWNVTGSLPHGISGTTLTVLDDGRVLLAGGGYGGSTVAETQLFDPSNGTWTPVAPMHHARSGAKSTLLTDGRVLVVGGGDGSSTPLLASEIYNPTTNTWTDDAALQNTHGSGKMVQLNNGSILMAGGYDATGPTKISELYTSTQPLRYDALGDSYSSGDGAPPYPADPVCKISDSSFPAFLRSDHNDLNLAQPHNIACTGATTSQVTGNQLGSLTTDNTTQKVNLVSITVGGDDVNFIGVLAQCYFGVATVNIFNVPFFLQDPISTATCVGQDTAVEAKIAALPTKLVSVYKGIHTAAPGARILVAGYPDIFPKTPTSSCDFLTKESVTWISKKIANVNGAIKKSVDTANANGSTGGKAEYVDSYDIFQNNHICSDHPWVNPLDASTLADKGLWSKGPPGYEYAFLHNFQNTPFHPNATGYQVWANTMHTYLVNNPK